MPVVNGVPVPYTEQQRQQAGGSTSGLDLLTLLGLASGPAPGAPMPVTEQQRQAAGANQAPPGNLMDLIFAGGQAPGAPVPVTEQQRQEAMGRGGQPGPGAGEAMASLFQQIQQAMQGGGQSPMQPGQPTPVTEQQRQEAMSRGQGGGGTAPAPPAPAPVQAPAPTPNQPIVNPNLAAPPPAALADAPNPVAQAQAAAAASGGPGVAGQANDPVQTGLARLLTDPEGFVNAAVSGGIAPPMPARNPGRPAGANAGVAPIAGAGRAKAESGGQGAKKGKSGLSGVSAPSTPNVPAPRLSGSQQASTAGGGQAGSLVARVISDVLQTLQSGKDRPDIFEELQRSGG